MIRHCERSEAIQSAPDGLPRRLRRLAMTMVCILTALQSIPAAAQDQDVAFQPSAEYAQCLRQPDAARGNATAVDVCLGLEQTIQLQRLDEAYQRVFDGLTGWEQVRLYNAQNEWLEALDARCAERVRNGAEVNTDSRAFNICRTVEIAARAAWLDDYSPE